MAMVEGWVMNVGDHQIPQAGSVQLAADLGEGRAG
jgi:hypothetical protein